MSEWIEHDGKDMPVSSDTLVLVRFRDGSPHYDKAGSERKAGSWHSHFEGWSNWHHRGTAADIVAYQIISQPQDLSSLGS